MVREYEINLSQRRDEAKSPRLGRLMTTRRVMVKRLRFVGILAADSGHGISGLKRRRRNERASSSIPPGRGMGIFRCAGSAPRWRRPNARPLARKSHRVAVSPLSSIGMNRPFPPAPFSRMGRERPAFSVAGFGGGGARSKSRPAAPGFQVAERMLIAETGEPIGHAQDLDNAKIISENIGKIR